MEVVLAIAAKIFEYSVEPVGQWFCYSVHYPSNIESLKNRVEDLHNARERVEHSTADALNNCEQIEADVRQWLTKVDRITEKAREVLVGEEEAGSRSSSGECLNLKLRYHLSREAKKIVQDIGEVLQNGGFNRVSYRPALQGTVTTPDTNYLTFKSRESTVKGLMKALGDVNINVIGVWGMGGVGKTTLVREVATQAKEGLLFDKFAMADVTQSPHIRGIQVEIADMLDLKFNVESTRGRADHLRKRLAKDSKILVILDNIWKTLDLDEIGIPSKGCKIVLISRIRDVLAHMSIEKCFELDVLPEEEAWNLFEKMAGDSVKDPHFQHTAREVAEKCARLPLALVTVSKALKDKSLYEWKDALQQLELPISQGLTEMQSTIYSCIELSYRYLKNQETQLLFLHCADMQETISLMDLLKYSYGLGLFNGIYTLEGARNRTYMLVRYLKDSCLLLDCPPLGDCCYRSEHFHMHDILRDVARSIALEDHNMIVVEEENRLKELNDQGVLRKGKAFSIYGGYIHLLPTEIEFPELKFLFADGRGCSLQIPDTFFQGMGRLRVLGFRKMQLSSLPSSLHCLTNLQTLCLDHCELKDITIIGKLKDLAILSLQGANILQLPKEIGLLTHLRMLDLSNCFRLRVIPPDVLSSLVELEELYMRQTYIQWEVEGLERERKNATLSELKHLSKLVTLEMCIQDATLPKDLLFERLERYAISIGGVWNWSTEHEISRTLELRKETSLQSEPGIKMLLKKTESLYLDELKDVNSIVNELEADGFQFLKHLKIKGNSEIKYIMDLGISVIAFPSLEILLLEHVISLEEICRCPASLPSFGKLRVVKIEKCDKLKFFVSSSIARGLSLLEELEITACHNMSAIVAKEGEIDDKHMTLFPRLHHLALADLPSLRSFVSIENLFMTVARETISEGKHDLHTQIQHEEVVFLNFSKVALSSIGIEETLLNQHCTRSSNRLRNMPTTNCFQNLLFLHFKGCRNVKHLLSFSVAKLMVLLKHLQIENCIAIEEILLTESLGFEEERIPKILFPRLESLHLCHLPILKRFCTGSDIEFSSLKELKLQGCPRVKTFICKSINPGTMVDKKLKIISTEEIPDTAVESLFNELVGFPSLEVLGIAGIVDTKIIFHNQIAMDSFCKLQSVTIQGCEKLITVFQSNILARFHSLEHLGVYGCSLLQEVSELLEFEEIIPKMSFPQLKSLYLEHLPILKRFCMGNNIDFPSLNSLYIKGCPRLKTFICKPISSKMTINKKLKEISTGESSCAVMEPFFNQMVAFPCLEVLQIVDVVDMKIIWHDQIASDSFCKLRSITIKGCVNLTNVFQSKMLATLHSLEHLGIYDCSSLQEVAKLQEIEEIIPKMLFLRLESLSLERLQILRRFCVGNEIKFPSLKNLYITSCPRLKTLIAKPPNSEMIANKELGQINAGESSHHAVEPFFSQMVAFPSLEVLGIIDIVDMIIIWHNQNAMDSFCKLRSVTIQGCANLVNVFQSNMMERFHSLEHLGIHDCSSLHEVSELQEFGEIIPKMLFPQLKSLYLERLPILRRFCVGNNIEFPSLKNLCIEGCSRLKTFICKPVNSEMIVNKRLSQTSAGGSSSIVKELFFNQMVAFPNLEVLEIADVVDMKIVWRNQMPTDSFCKLRSITIQGCENLTNVFQSKMLARLHKLEHLGIYDCSSLQEVSELLEFEEITPKVLFLGLKSLYLERLQVLKRFCMGNQIEFPSLKNLYITGCPRLKTFISEPISPKMTANKELKQISAGESSHIVMESFFNEMVVFPRLEVLGIINIVDMKIIWHSQVATDSFCKLRSITIQGCENLTSVFQSNMLGRFQSLEHLGIYDCNSLQEVSELQEFEQMIPKMLFPRLQSLYLERLPELKRFCLGDEIEFPSLKNLYITGCLRLKTFISKPFSSKMIVNKELEQIIAEKSSHIIMEPLFNQMVSFPRLEVLGIIDIVDVKIIWHKVAKDSFCKLRSLTIEGCKDLASVFQSNMLASLHSLENLCIYDCSSLLEVSELQESEEIIPKMLFPRLKSLYLERLPKLNRFCVGSDIGFPSLKKLDIKCCPRLKTFICKPGSLEMSAREHSHVVTEALFNQMVAFPSLELLEIYDIFDIKTIWDSQIVTNSFCKLRCIIIEGCVNLTHIFPSNMLTRLHSLEKLKVCNCSSLQEVSAIQGVEEMIPEMPFPRLESLLLEGLPILKGFCMGSDIEFPSLKESFIERCPRFSLFTSKLVNSGTIANKEIKELNAGESSHIVTEPLFNQMDQMK